MQQFLNCGDLVRRAVDWFSNHLKETQSAYELDEKNLDHYQLYWAKKNGRAKDDYSCIDKTQLVSKTNFQRFALTVDKEAISKRATIIAHSEEEQETVLQKQRRSMGATDSGAAKMEHNTGTCS